MLKMNSSKLLSSSPFIISTLSVSLLPSAFGSFHGEDTSSSNHKGINGNVNKLSTQMTSYVAIHGLLLWVSMGFLMPVGILTIRMTNKEESEKRVKVVIYLHAILQALVVLIATAGAVMSIKNFENSFNNNHQRLGLALYGAILMQALVGVYRPSRGNKRRSTWYLAHWILGIVIYVVSIINIYSGLQAYHKRTSRSTVIWTILFSAQISFIAFFYLFQDKWEYIQRQGLIQPNPPSPSDEENGSQRDGNQKVLLPEPCGKRNSLRNLFD